MNDFKLFGFILFDLIEPDRSRTARYGRQPVGRRCRDAMPRVSADRVNGNTFFYGYAFPSGE
jgi:hypothetical protein